MLTDAFKRCAEAMVDLADTVRPPADLETEIARTAFVLYQHRIMASARHYNYLAVCHRIGIDPHG